MFVKNINLKTKKMKRKFFSILAIAAIAMTSCKKEEVLDSNQLGEATIKGNVFAYLDERNDINADGLYIENLVPEVVAGIAVSVSINTEIWDQSPDTNYDYPTKTFTTVTDAEGNYTLTFPATDKPNMVTVKFGNMLGTYYTYSADGTELSKQIEVIGGSQSIDVYAGANANVRHQAGWNNVSGTSQEYGSATFRVVYKQNWDYTNGYGNDTLTSTALIGQTITLTYNSAPTDLSDNTFSAIVAIDANNPTQAIAEFTVPTRLAGQGAVNFFIQTPDFQGTYTTTINGADYIQNAIWNFNNNNLFDGQAVYDGSITTRYMNGNFNFTDN